jgi:hypothetical protein
MLADDLRLEAAGAVAGDLDPHRPVVGEHGLGAGAVAVIALPVGSGLAGAVAQVLGHLGAHRPLDDGLLERPEHRFEITLGHRPAHQLVQQFIRDARLRGACRRRRLLRSR